MEISAKSQSSTNQALYNNPTPPGISHFGEGKQWTSWPSSIYNVVVLETLSLIIATVGAGELDDRRYQDHRFLSLALFPMPRKIRWY